MNHPLRFALIGVLVVSARLPAQVATSIPDASQLPFSWGRLVPGTNVANFNVHAYVNPDGSAGGSRIDSSDPVTTADATGQSLGTVRWQFALFKASTSGAAGPINEVGAALMGGFQLTRVNLDPAIRFSFLQTYSDAYDPAPGTIDGGGPFGKTNADIPDWNHNPGWNFDGAETQYDYFDVPFDAIYLDPETVSFETALIAHEGTRALVLDDIRWGYTANTGSPGNLTGASPAPQPAASDDLLTLYRGAFPGTTYYNQSQATLADLPEPGAPVVAASVLAYAARRRRPRRRGSRPPRY